jgi:CHAT domain-containing protein/tetratricopeptide (TPR) repeat protein
MKAKLLFLLLILLTLPLHAHAAVSAKDVDKAFTEGQAAYKEGRLDDAAADFTKAADALVSLKQQDKARAVYNNVAIIRMKQERWQDAYDIYTKALGLPGKLDGGFHVKATGNMAYCAEKAQRHDLKAEAIDKLLRSKTKIEQVDLLNFLSMQGDAYRASERYALACKSYEKALTLKDVPQDKRVTILTGLGLAQGNLGRYPKALASLSEALKDATALQQQMAIVEATSNIGVIYWEMGQYEKASEMLEKALGSAKDFKLRRNEGVDSNNIGLVYKSAGQLNEAIKRIDTALAIAREVNNPRDEAIALSNRALLLRMSGDNKAARDSYAKALEMYRTVAFTEGEASTLMGLAKMDMVVDKNYGAALEKLTNAAAIYEKLENPGFLAEAYVQLGQLYQKIATPNRKTRDLVFEDDEPEGVSLAPAEALAKSKEFYAKALPLAEKTGRKEIIWSALHGMAFVERENKRLAAAMDYYTRAVDVVLSMKGTEENPDLLLEFLRDKDDLFAEAIDVCSRLYEQKKDPALLQKQMEYDEIYRNEVVRAHSKLASLSYAEPEKKALYNEIVQLTSSKKKTEAAARESAKDESPAAKAENAIVTEETSLVAKEFEDKLKLWKSRYPNDAALFDAAVNVNMDDLRAKLAADQAIVQYFPLEDSLIILTATNEEIAMTRVEVAYDKLASLIRDEFIAVNIEGFGHSDRKKLPSGEPNMCFDNEGPCYEQMLAQLQQLYQYLYAPVADKLKDKPRLYIVTSKYLSYVPFAGLIIERRENAIPHFLVEDKTITLSRLSFMQTSLGAQQKTQADTGNIIAVGDPQHDVLEVTLRRLGGAKAEAQLAADSTKEIAPQATATVMLGEDAKKSLWRKNIADTQYSVFYFATHGIPYAEIKYDSGNIRRSVEKAIKDGISTVNKKPIALYQNFLSFYDANFTNNSHLNGFLFMAYPDGKENGLLTLREIQELPDSSFAKASLAVLSACNTAVSYSPKVAANENVQEDLESIEASKELADAGWTPGVDQVCLVDTFMKKKFRNVYGTLWFADDDASAMIMSSFMKNLKEMPPAQALRKAQLYYLQNLPKNIGDYPMHPYFWACGNIFGQ